MAHETRLGIVGNRIVDGVDPQTLVGTVERTLEHLSRALDAQSAAPPKLVMLNSLAEGADQLVALAAERLGMEFVIRCPIPFTREEYKNLFTIDREHAIATFDRLTSGTAGIPVEVIELRHSVESPEARNKGYAAAAHHVVRHSDLLLAIYDPSRPGARGGTEETVAEAQEAALPIFRIDTKSPGRIDEWAGEDFVALTTHAFEVSLGRILHARL